VVFFVLLGLSRRGRGRDRDRYLRRDRERSPGERANISMMIELSKRVE